MTPETLQQATKLQKEHDQLDRFIEVAERRYKLKIFSTKHTALMLQTPQEMWVQEHNLVLTTELKDAVLQVLKDRRSELKRQMDNL